MDYKSEFIDSIRVGTAKKKARQKGKGPGDTAKQCDWPECNKRGGHPAPMGRGREGEYFSFCIDHVREYNKSYNFFKGMSEDEQKRFQESIITGHRPTWEVSSNANGKNQPRNTDAHEWGLAGRRNPNKFTGGTPEDLHGVTGLGAEGAAKEAKPRPAKRLPVKTKRSLQELGLGADADAETIKERFKELAKRHHPDTSQDSGSEEKLRNVIQAYNYLKKVGMC